MADIRRVTKENAISIVQGLKALYTNQNAIGKIKVGNTTFTADEAIDQLQLVAGSNMTVTIDNDTVTFAATDTTYSAVVADSATPGLMTGADKTKLDGIEAGAEVNQNAFAGIKVGADTVNAAAEGDTVELVAGSNVTITVGNDGKLTFAAADTTYTLVQDSNDGHTFTFTPSNGQATTVTIPDSDTTYDPAEASTGGVGGTDGLITAEDQEKLDGVADGAQVNVIEGVKVGANTLTLNNKVAELGTAAGATVGTTVANDATLPTGAAVQSYVAGLGYQTASDVATAIAGAQHITMSIVSTLPASGESNVIYLVPDDQGGNNKDMYIYSGSEFVLVGNTEVDLSDYVQFDDLGGLLPAEITEILAEA